MRTIMLVLAAAIASAALAGNASAYHPNAQTKWRQIVAVWTKQADSAGRRIQCGNSVLVDAQCKVTPTIARYKQSPFARVSIWDDNCVWKIAVSPQVGPNAGWQLPHPRESLVNVCQPGWTKVLPRPW